MTDIPLSTLNCSTRNWRSGGKAVVHRSAHATLQDAPKATIAHAKLIAAHELVRRFLEEELKRECVLTSPAQTREYLRAVFAGLEHEKLWGCFSTISTASSPRRSSRVARSTAQRCIREK